MTLLHDRVWLPGDVKAIAGASQAALLTIEKRVVAGRVAVHGEALGWGQYLDQLHHSPSQWGLLGTSAGYQVLGRVEAEGSPVPELAQVRLLLPDDVQDEAALHPAVREKADAPKFDLQNIFRLAAIAEALAAPRSGTILNAPHPPIVDHIFSLARHGRCWNARSAKPGGQDLPGDAVTTAFVLHALRRYEDDASRYRPVRTWLARQLLNDETLRARPDYLALTGLALSAPRWDVDNPEDVQSAIQRCQDDLLAWRRRERTLVINRPLFEGYQLGTSTDYLIFNPELMAALFFLRQDNPRPSRRFVASVTRELSRNVQVNRGFEGQLGMLPTVDQEWASRLLALFVKTYKDKARRHLLLPGRLTSPAVRWGLFGGAVLVLAGVLLAVGVDFETGVLVFLAGAAVTAVSLVVQRGGTGD